MLLRTLIILLVSVDLLQAERHGYSRKHHHVPKKSTNSAEKKHDIKNTLPRAMIWPKKLMPSLHRMLSHRRHHHPHHNLDSYGLNGDRESDTINLENRIQGMLGTGGGGGFGTPNGFMGQEEFPDAAGRSSSDRYLVNKIMNSVNSETGDEANAFQDMMSELRMVKEAKEKKELLSTLGLNGLGFANNNQPPPMAEVSTLPPSENKFQGGKFEPPANNLGPGSKLENFPQEFPQEQSESQQFSPNEEEDQMTQSSYHEEQPRFRDEQPRFEDQNEQDVGGNMEMRSMEAGGDERPQFNDVPPQQNEQEPVNIRGSFIRERWPEESPPESFPQEPVREMSPPRNPGPPMGMNDLRGDTQRNIEEEGGNRWDPMQGPNMADRRMIFGGRHVAQRSSGPSFYRFNRPNIRMQPQVMRAANIEAGPARILDPSHPQEQYRRERPISMMTPPVRRRQFPHDERAYTRTQTYSFMNAGPPQTVQQTLFNGRGLPFSGGKPFPPQSPDFMMESGGRGMPSLRHSSFRSEQESNMFMRPDGRWRFTGFDEGDEGDDIPAYRKTKVLKKKGSKYHNGTIIDGTKFRTLVKNKKSKAPAEKTLIKKITSLNNTSDEKTVNRELTNNDRHVKNTKSELVKKRKERYKATSQIKLNKVIRNTNSTSVKSETIQNRKM